MKPVLLILPLVLTIISCGNADEVPLLLPSAAEPSAKIYNDRGIEYFYKGKHLEALIAFTQATVADNTSGEIQYNLALVQHQKGKQKEARDHLRLAQKFAGNNKKILESYLFKKYLD